MEKQALGNHQEHSLSPLFAGSPVLLCELEARRRRLIAAIHHVEEKPNKHDSVDLERVPEQKLPHMRELFIEDERKRRDHLLALRTELQRVTQELNVLQESVHTSCLAILPMTRVAQHQYVVHGDQDESHSEMRRVMKFKRKKRPPRMSGIESDPALHLRLNPDIARLFRITNPYEKPYEDDLLAIQKIPDGPSIVGGVDDVSMNGLKPVGFFTVKEKK